MVDDERHRITLRVDHADSGHTHFAIFMNGGKAGDLCLRTDEFREFAPRLNATITFPDERAEKAITNGS